MKSISIKEQVVLNGRTYLPGKYKIVANNLDAGPDEVHESEADKLLANHPQVVKPPSAKKKKVAGESKS